MRKTLLLAAAAFGFAAAPVLSLTGTATQRLAESEFRGSQVAQQEFRINDRGAEREFRDQQVAQQEFRANDRVAESEFRNERVADRGGAAFNA
jgi:hypothetical protein